MIKKKERVRVMCNIAGYAGNRQAAPILLQMLRRQEYYDGNVSTGVVTIHEGKLHYRKIVGTVDDLMEKTDVMDLPGTIGIAHTRPSGSTVAYQPCISPDKTSALATNGIFIKSPHTHLWNEAVELLLSKGYTFTQVLDQNFKPPCMPDGTHIFPLEVRLALVNMYVDQGKSFTEALALSCSHMFGDNATVVISQRQPDSFFAMRTSRPLLALEERGETFIATSRYAFDEGKEELARYLPLHYACEITRSGVRVSGDKIQVEPVAQITPEAFQRGYDYICRMLSVPKEKALYFDDLELDLLHNIKQVFKEDYAHTEHARLVYDVLWQLKKEGRLCQELRTQQVKAGLRKRWYFWLEDNKA